MTHRIKTALIAAGALCLASQGIAQGTTMDSTQGESLFARFCATCHGADATGGGPMSNLLTKKVPDLTTLSARNGGQFPMRNVVHVIDGRTDIRAHGGPMPVYGDMFDRDAPRNETAGAVIEARGNILSLAYYLESIQR
ncbi:c-type cytochrome [Roseivivax sp. CAU 1753]